MDLLDTKNRNTHVKRTRERKVKNERSAEIF